MLSDIDRAIDALKTIPNSVTGDEWLRPSIAAKAAGISFDKWHTWCEGAPNYKGEADCRARWQSFDANGPIQAGTLFKAAAEHGWRIGGNTSQRPAPARATPKPAEPPRKPAYTVNADAVWSRGIPATVQHPYPVKKNASPEALQGLRVLPADDPLRIGGVSMAGALVVPCMAADGTLATLQLIPPTGKKMNLPGHSLQGWFTVGTMETGQTVYIVEGIGTAWAVWMATGAAAVVCFGAGNIRKVATALRQSDADARLVLCPDVGKESDADKIAAEVGAAVARMPEGWPVNSDLNDLFCSPDGGFDVVAALLESATEPPKPEPLLKPVSVFDLFTRPSPPPDFAWESYCPLDEVTLFAANGGTGKSVIGLMLAVSVALGRPLFDVPTRPGKVLFASLEDGADLVRHRLTGICRAWQVDPEQLRDRLAVVDGTEHPELFTVEGRAAGDVTSSYAELRSLAEGATLVLVDNASDAYGGDEIKRREVRAFVRVLKRIAKAEHAAVVLLAHVNAMTARARKPDNDESYSGSTAWNNSVRSRLFLSRDELGLLTLAHQKANLSKRREPITLQWLDDGLPELVQAEPGFDGSRQQGRGDDKAAAGLLRLIAEFEGREQYCSPATTARNNPFVMLRSEPSFQSLKLNADSTKRVINQCQRAKWIEPLDYKSAHSRKYCQRWTVTADGRLFAGLPAPTAPTAPTCHEGEVKEQGANVVHPLHPHMQGGTGGIERTDVGAQEGVCHD